VRKITSGIQLNTSSVKDFKGASDTKAKNPEEDFAAVLESAATSAKSEAKDETGQKADPEAKEGLEVKKKPGAKEETEPSIPVMPPEAILQKSPVTDPAERASIGKQLAAQTVQKGSKGPSGKEELSEIKVMKPESENAVSLVQSESGSLNKNVLNADSGKAAKAGEKKPSDQKDAAVNGSLIPESPGTESLAYPAPSEPPDKTQNISLEAKIKEKRSNTEDKSGSTLGIVGDASSKNNANAVSPAKTESIPMDKMSGDRNLQIVATEIAHKVETMSDGESTSIRVKLFPKGIGEVEISLSMGEGKLSGKILVENKEIRQMFTDRLNELNQTFKENNINVAKFEVGIGYGQGQSQGRQQSQRHVFYQSWKALYTDEIAQFDERKAASKATVRGINVLA
jgi:flagellar hook-length control protein FliK